MQVTISRRAAAVLVAAVALALGATYAYASIPDTGGVIHGCFNNANGQLRVFDPAGTKSGPCSPAETGLDWSQTGPQGPQGLQGPQGPIGASPFSLNGTSAYFNAGRVGLGTASPLGWQLVR